MKKAARQYGAERAAVQRVIIAMPEAEVEAIDRWGVPAGMPSRTAAIRTLLQEGLRAAKSRDGGGPAAGKGLEG
ncbi:hypothetical protein [Falsiroseomonas tokyonensis]|uniref:Ribbon-helix-helix protein CopG domain-containing protein n=1 Tax=Falsiroseomonas tokyonensis TaxID=430521 RepID=A0ABV7BZI1_9PROT|nr:hypothetical protein [Falsiroseomonas tokyonensis]MBU8540813.1 hypothetical protein [Falsiroseomonas tokyonensis]